MAWPYGPDYLVNAGGLINVCAELQGWPPSGASGRPARSSTRFSGSWIWPRGRRSPRPTQLTGWRRNVSRPSAISTERSLAERAGRSTAHQAPGEAVVGRRARLAPKPGAPGRSAPAERSVRKRQGPSASEHGLWQRRSRAPQSACSRGRLPGLGLAPVRLPGSVWNREKRCMTSGLWADLRSGIRALSHRSASTVSALVVLAVGIGGATSTFSIVYATLLRPLPFEEPDCLVAGRSRAPPPIADNWSGPDFLDVKDQALLLDGVAGTDGCGSRCVAPRRRRKCGRLGHRQLLRCAGCVCPVRTGVSHLASRRADGGHQVVLESPASGSPASARRLGSSTRGSP